MMQRNLLLVAIVVVAGAGIAWFGFVRKQETVRENPPVLAGPAATVQPDDPIAALEIPTPAADAGEMPGEAVSTEGERATLAVEPVDFDVKYANWSLERLEGANAVLSKTMMSRFAEVHEQRMKDGHFTELILKDGEPTPEMTGNVRVFGESAGPGLQRYKITEVPLEEYPALQALKNEVDWLHSKTYRMARASAR